MLHLSQTSRWSTKGHAMIFYSLESGKGTWTFPEIWVINDLSGFAPVTNLTPNLVNWFMVPQVHDTLQMYSSGTGLRIIMLAGDGTAEKERTLLWTKNVLGEYECDGADVIISTVGRLQQHLRYSDPYNAQMPRSLDLSHLRLVTFSHFDFTQTLFSSNDSKYCFTPWIITKVITQLPYFIQSFEMI